jgi:hypothetical protein
VPRWAGYSWQLDAELQQNKRKAPRAKARCSIKIELDLEHLTSPFIRISDADRETKATETWRGESLLKVTSGKSP